MTTMTQSPLDAAGTALSEAQNHLDDIAADLRYWEGVARMLRGTAAARDARAHIAKIEAGQNDAFDAYDLARAELDRQIALRPDLKVCTCGIPDCDGAL